MLRQASKARVRRRLPSAWISQEAPSNLVLFFIQAEFQGATRSHGMEATCPDPRRRSMLEQAFEMRSLIVMLDGIDEARQNMPLVYTKVAWWIP